jgi:aminopeptidase N
MRLMHGFRAAACVVLWALAGTRVTASETPPLKFERLDLAIKVFPAQKRIEGDATLRFATSSHIDSLQLDLHPGFHVAEVSVSGRRAVWKHSEHGQIHIQLPAPAAAGKAFAVRVVYAGFPQIARNPPWEGGMIWSETPEGQPWIGNSQWGGGCDLLWPCIDHPTYKPEIADVRFTVPAPLVAPGNGVLVGVTEKNSWRTFRWRARSPHTYGIVINAGPFTLLEASYESRFGNSIPMKFWYLPANEREARELFEEFPRILAFFESRIGPYPWGDEKMGVVQMPYRGMEHQTINAYGNEFTKTPYGFDALLHHEFSHEYFGNQVSASNYDDLWLHEGFASYMQLLYAEHLHDYANYYALLMETRALICNEQPLVSGRIRSQGEVYAEGSGPRSDIYHKGSLVLHTLRNLIGDEAFFSALRQLVYGRPDPKPGNFVPQFRTTADFVRIVNATTKQDLSWFFDVYLYERELPRLRQSHSGQTLTLHWEVAGDKGFPMPLEVRVGNETVQVPMPHNRGTVQVPPDSHVIIDPYAKVLRQSDAIDRYHAWRAAQHLRNPHAHRADCSVPPT